MRPPDTTPEAWEIQLDIYRRMSPEEKAAAAFALTEQVRTIAEAELRQKFPHASDREVFLRRVQLQLGDELFRKAYGDELPPE